MFTSKIKNVFVKTLSAGSYVCEAQTTHDKAHPQVTEVIVQKRIKVT